MKQTWEFNVSPEFSYCYCIKKSLIDFSGLINIFYRHLKIVIPFDIHYLVMYSFFDRIS